MRAAFAALVLVLAACAAASAQTIGNPNAPWRAHAVTLEGDQWAAHNCLQSGINCENSLQQGCLSAHGQDEITPAIERQCDWRAMAAWENEIMTLLADLRGKLDGDNLRHLNESEDAWERSMLADVGLGMDYYAGGSISGPIGAHIRARATAQRAAYLYEIQQMVDE